MTTLQAIVLGIVQGLTEFLPVSSSGHLVLVPWLAGWTIDPRTAFAFDVLVQLGTLSAVIVYFRVDLWQLVRAALSGLLSGKPFASNEARLAWMLLVASIPAAMLGLLFKSRVESAFTSPRAVGGFLLLTSALLAISERVGKRTKDVRALTALDALLIGLAQAASLFPGVSRSGATISGGLLRELNRKQAARFAFLMAVPIMLGAGFIAAMDMVRLTNLQANLVAVLAGVASAAVVGFLSIRWLLAYLSKNSLKPFIIYCAIVGALAILLGTIRG